MKLKENIIIFKDLETESIAIPVGFDSYKFHGVVSINEPVTILLQAMQEKPLSKEAMVSILTDEYQVDPETAAADLDVLIRDLLEMGLIEA